MTIEFKDLLVGGTYTFLKKTGADGEVKRYLLIKEICEDTIIGAEFDISGEYLEDKEYLTDIFLEQAIDED